MRARRESLHGQNHNAFSSMPLVCQKETPLFSIWPLYLNRGKWRALGICINLRAIAEANVCDFKSVISRMSTTVVSGHWICFYLSPSDAVKYTEGFITWNLNACLEMFSYYHVKWQEEKIPISNPWGKNWIWKPLGFYFPAGHCSHHYLLSY